MKSILTFSALNCFRNCPRKYRLRYVEYLRRPESPEALAFGDLIHACLQAWYTLPADAHKLLVILDLIDARFPNKAGDPAQKAAWHLARAIMAGYAARYAEEEFEVLHVEKDYDCEIRNPDTGRASQTFTIAGKVDGIVRIGGELYLLEHKTASTLSGDYLDKLWCDTQIALYTFYLRQLGFPVVGVVYNVLLTVTDNYTGLSITLAAGECLFTGARFGSRRADGGVQFQYAFSALPNKTDLTVGDITVASKKGWEYMWVLYDETDDEDADYVVQWPLAAYVNKVYEYGDFSLLGLS